VRIYIHGIYIKGYIDLLKISSEFKIYFTKIERKVYLANSSDKKFILFFEFGVLMFVGFEKSEIENFINILSTKYEINSDIYENYNFFIEQNLTTDFKIEDKEIKFKTYNQNLVLSALLVIAQSIALEQRELEMSRYFEYNKDIFNSFNKLSVSYRKKLVEFLIKATLLRYEIISKINLLDKSDALWEDDLANKVYEDLSKFFDLKDRYKILEYKLEHLRESIELASEIVNQKEMDITAILIIILIAVAIGIEIVSLIVGHIS